MVGRPPVGDARILVSVMGSVNATARGIETVTAVIEIGIIVTVIVSATEVGTGTGIVTTVLTTGRGVVRVIIVLTTTRRLDADRRGIMRVTATIRRRTTIRRIGTASTGVVRVGITATMSGRRRTGRGGVLGITSRCRMVRMHLPKIVRGALRFTERTPERRESALRTTIAFMTREQKRCGEFWSKLIAFTDTCFSEHAMILLPLLHQQSLNVRKNHRQGLKLQRKEKYSLVLDRYSYMVVRTVMLDNAMMTVPLALQFRWDLS